MTYKNQNLNSAQLLRQKAEKKLGENQKTMATPIAEIEVKRLVHELQVHQIQLEMQNEELKQANESAETALKKHTMLFDFAPMGFYT